MKVLIFFLVLLITYLFFIISDKSPYNKDSFGGKTEKANLQAIKDGMGEKKVITDKLFLMLFNGSEVLVVTKDKNKCGILLNCEYPPYYKEFGECSKLKLTYYELNFIKRNTQLTTTVRDILFLKFK